MITIIAIVVGIAAAVMFYSMIALYVRQGIALFKNDEEQYNRLSIPYDIAEMMAMKDFGVRPEVFELIWNELKAVRPDVLPYDVYLKLRNRE